MIKYKIDCLLLLKQKGYNTNIIRKNKLLNEGSLQSFRENKIIGMKELDKLCKLLELQPGDIIEYVADEIIQNASFVWNSGTTQLLICSKFGTVEQHLLIVVSKCYRKETGKTVSYLIWCNSPTFVMFVHFIAFRLPLPILSLLVFSLYPHGMYY